MRYVDFKSVVNEMAAMKDNSKGYWRDEDYRKKYVGALIDNIQAGKGVEVSTTEQTKNFPAGKYNITSDNMKQVLSLFNGILSGKTEFSKDMTIPVVHADTGETINLPLTKIEKPNINVNAGNITEGFLGFGMAAKFSNTTKDITEDDVLQIGQKFFANEGPEITIPVTDRTNDKLVLKVTLPKPDLKALRYIIEEGGDAKKALVRLGMDPKKSKTAIDKLNALPGKVVNYANTGTEPKNALAIIRDYYTDGVRQTLSVMSDGAEVENQNNTKVDLKIGVDGKDEDRTISLLSLKAGSGRSQIGQASGKAYNNLRLFWLQNFNYKLPSDYVKYWEQVDKEIAGENGKIEVNPENTLKYLQGPIRKTYEWAETKINSHLAGDKTEGEVDFLEHLQKGLLFHSGKNIDPADRANTMVKGDNRVVVTIIDFGKTNDFYELRFAESFLAILSYFDLVSTGLKDAKGGKGMFIQVYVKPKAKPGVDTPKEILDFYKKLGPKGQVLVQYRSYVQSETTIRNIIEVDKGAKILGAVSNEQYKIAKAVKQAEEEPKKPDAPKKQEPVAPKQPLNKEPQQDQVVSAEV